jgi:hypothetical protein
MPTAKIKINSNSKATEKAGTPAAARRQLQNVIS